MVYLIGDTIRFNATVVNFDGDQQAPAAITLTVYQADGVTKLLDGAAMVLKTGRIAEYYYDWLISTALTAAETLTAVLDWTGPHKKKLEFDVEPAA